MNGGSGLGVAGVGGLGHGGHGVGHGAGAGLGGVGHGVGRGDRPHARGLFPMVLVCPGVFWCVLGVELG